MDAFKHDSIDLSRPAIRVVRLCRGYYTDSVRCELFEASLDPSEIIPYKALSYVWGEGSDQKEICINEKKAFVTRNLFKALKSLRQMYEDLILWIDAICIDQDNHKEKGHQVSQMRLVYEHAEEVIISLGESNDNIDILFECAVKLDKAMGTLRTRKTTFEDWKALWDKKEKERLRFDAGFGVDYGQRRLSALQGLLRRPWFSRVWVIQEAASAKRAMVMCGSNTVSTRIFTMLPRLMEEPVAARTQAILDVMPGPLRSASSWWNASRDLETLLKKFGSSESSNPRDLIYALLGISSNFKESRILTPDYEISFEETVQNTIWALLFDEVLDRRFYNLPVWDKWRFVDSMRDLPGSVFTWAVRAKETPVLIRLLTSGGGPKRVEDPNSGRGLLHDQWPLHTLIEMDGPLNAIQSFMPHADNDINRMSNIYQEGPLHIAANKGLAPVAHVLLQHPKVDVNLRGSGAIVKNMLQVSKYYSNFVIFDIDREVYGPDTPLNIAVVKGHSSVVKLLVKYRSNGVRVRAKHEGGTALHLAAAVLRLEDQPESGEVVRLLLQHDDVDLNGKDWRGNSPLNIAVIQGNAGMVRALLRRERTDVNHVGASGTPLESAIRAKETSIIASLVEDARTDHEEVLRMIKRAVWERPDQPAVLKELLSGCSHKDSEILGQALVRALGYGDLSMAQMLLGRGARINGHGEPFRYEPDNLQHDMTQLAIEVGKEHKEAVQLLLCNELRTNDLDSGYMRGVPSDSEVMTAVLTRAIRQRRMSLVIWLLTYGAAIHQRDSHGATSLLDLLHQDSHEAVWSITGTLRASEKGANCPWDIRAIEMLRLHGVSISCKPLPAYSGPRKTLIVATIRRGDESRWIFDEAAALRGHRTEDSLEIRIEHERETWELTGIADLLLKYGADIEARDSRGATLLWMAVSRNYVGLVDLLLSCGANKETTDSYYGWTPLWIAALLDFSEIVRKLCRHGANTQVRCRQGKTPLHIAAEKGCSKAIRALLDFGADRDVIDYQSRTPLDLALKNGHLDVARGLLPAI